MRITLATILLGAVFVCAYAGPVPLTPNRAVPIPVIQPVIASDPPNSYEFGYQSVDEQGTTQHRQETSNGKDVKGSYGYMDPLGVYRIVKYVADDGGFRAVVTSNEPGMGTSSSANAVYVVQPPPAAALVVQGPKYFVATRK